MSADQALTPFTGFSVPTYTPVPDELFDQLMVDLSLAELRVLLYICRRTFGFKKREDAIALSQMLGGIRRRDGVRLDRGVGLSRRALLPAIRSLVEHGVIVKT
ncbi:MAG: replication protein, partial [Pseudomonadota bacterium]